MEKYFEQCYKYILRNFLLLFHCCLALSAFSFEFLPTKASAATIIQAPLYIGLTSGLVGSWSFDGASMNATKALDTSGNGNHGTLTNGPRRAVAKVGQGLQFEASNSHYVTVADTADTDFGANTDFTIAAWVKHSGVAQDAGGGDGWRIVSKYETGSPQDYYFLRVNDTSAAEGGVVDPDATITTANDGNATRFNQRQVVKNPRGVGAYYAIVQKAATGSESGLRVLSSTDGSTWTDRGQLTTSGDAAGADNLVGADVYAYDDGSQFIMYVAYAGNEGYTQHSYRKCRVG